MLDRVGGRFVGREDEVDPGRLVEVETFEPRAEPVAEVGRQGTARRPAARPRRPCASTGRLVSRDLVSIVASVSVRTPHYLHAAKTPKRLPRGACYGPSRQRSSPSALTLDPATAPGEGERSTMMAESEEQPGALRLISNGISALDREHYGRGARRVRTQINGELVITMLEDPFTAVEKTMIAQGAFLHVRETWTMFQDWMQPGFTSSWKRRPDGRSPSSRSRMTSISRSSSSCSSLLRRRASPPPNSADRRARSACRPLIPS